MTGLELKTMTETILDDTVDEVLFYQLANNSKNRIEGSRPWMMLRSLDSTKVTGGGNNSDTPIALPTDWRRTYKLLVGPDQQYEQVPFDTQHSYRNSAGRYVIDVANRQYYILGAERGGDIVYNYYIKTTPDITATTSPVWPEDYTHAIIAHEVVAFIMAGVDADSEFSRMSQPNSVVAITMLDEMKNNDNQMQLTAQGGRIQVEGETGGINLGMM